MQREMESEMAAVRIESKNMQETAKDERLRWIEDQVEELERWDGME
jgi:hypothetical protein